MEKPLQARGVGQTKGGRFAGTGTPTDRQERFAHEYVNTGGNAAAAARAAGYATETAAQEGFRLLRKPHVLQAIKDAQIRYVEAEGGAAALATLLEVARDIGAPAAARVAAARALLGASGVAPSGPSDGAARFDGKRLSEMSIAELEAFIQGGVAELKASAGNDD